MNNLGLYILFVALTFISMILIFVDNKSKLSWFSFVWCLSFTVYYGYKTLLLI